jgi:hypothetical protein
VAAAQQPRQDEKRRELSLDFALNSTQLTFAFAVAVAVAVALLAPVSCCFDNNTTSASTSL